MSRVRLKQDDNDLRVLVARVRANPRGVGGGHEHVYSYADEWPELLGYKIPSRFPSDELEVLDKYLSSSRSPTSAELELGHLADAMLYTSMPAFGPPEYADSPISAADIIRALCVGGRDKSPGYPLMYDYRTKGEAFDEILEDLYFAVHVRLLALKYVAPHCKTPDDFLDCYCADPMSFSIKKESVTSSKKGRPLIAYSYIDAAVEFIWSHTYAAALKATHFEGHSAIGLGFGPSDAELLRTSVGPGPYFKSDVPGFDGGVMHDERSRVITLALRRMGLGPGNWLFNIAHMHEIAISNPVFIMTNGSCYRPVVPIGQLSGRFLTSRINTDVRARRSYLVDTLLLSLGRDIKQSPLCAGDDAIEDATPDRERAYAYVGYPLRDAEESPQLTFCSFNWDNEPYGLRLDKALFNLLLNAPITKDKFSAFVMGFRHHPRFVDASLFIFGRRPEMKEVSRSFFSQKMIDHLDAIGTFALDYEPHARRKGKQKGKAKAKKRAPAAPVRMVGPSAVTSKMAMQVCSITNPFCPEAVGAKYPDNATTKSATFTLRRPFIATTDANGNAAWLWAANWGGNGAAATVTGTTAAYTDISQNMTQFPANVSRYRLVSWGVQVTPIVAPLSASGMIRVRLFSPEGGTSLTSIDTTSNLADDSYDVPLARNQRDLFILPKRYGMESTMFQNAQTATNVLTDWNNPGWQVIQIAVTNGPATSTVLQMSVFYHYEVVYLDGDPGNYYATPAPVVAPKVIETSSGVISKIGSFVEGTANTVDRVMQSSAFKYLAGAVGGFFGGPTGASRSYGAAKALGDTRRLAIMVD